MMAKHSHNGIIFLFILTGAIIARLYGLKWEPFSVAEKASVILSVLAGILSVAGIYLLVKELFDERIALIASFFLTISSWHIAVSQSGANASFMPFALIFTLYFIWRGLKRGHVFDFFFAGLFGGAGLYAGKEFFAAPFVILLIFWNYWDYMGKDFALSKYEEVKRTVLGGFSLLFLTAIAAAFPVGMYVWQNPSFILSAGDSVFVDMNWAFHIFQNFRAITQNILLLNFENGNLVSWPLSIFFAIGFIKEFVHWLKRKHGHFSVAHTVVFSWLFVMAVPTLLSLNGYSLLGLSIILPPVLILSAKGLWWTIEKLNKWEHFAYPRPHDHYAGLNAGPFLALLAILLSTAILEISKLV